MRGADPPGTALTCRSRSLLADPTGPRGGQQTLARLAACFHGFNALAANALGPLPLLTAQFFDRVTGADILTTHGAGSGLRYGDLPADEASTGDRLDQNACLQSEDANQARPADADRLGKLSLGGDDAAGDTDELAALQALAVLFFQSAEAANLPAVLGVSCLPTCLRSKLLSCSHEFFLSGMQRRQTRRRDESTTEHSMPTRRPQPSHGSVSWQSAGGTSEE